MGNTVWSLDLHQYEARLLVGDGITESTLVERHQCRGKVSLLLRFKTLIAYMTRQKIYENYSGEATLPMGDTITVRNENISMPEVLYILVCNFV